MLELYPPRARELAAAQHIDGKPLVVFYGDGCPASYQQKLRAVHIAARLGGVLIVDTRSA